MHGWDRFWGSAGKSCAISQVGGVLWHQCHRTALYPTHEPSAIHRCAVLVGQAQWWSICSCERKRKFGRKTLPGCFESNSLAKSMTQWQESSTLKYHPGGVAKPMERAMGKSQWGLIPQDRHDRWWTVATATTLRLASSLDLPGLPESPEEKTKL